MTDADPIEEHATMALDAILPRRDPRYSDAHAYLYVYLSTDPATRRLAMRALKRYEYFSPDPEQTETASPPVAATAAPASGEVHDGVAAPRAEESGDVKTADTGSPQVGMAPSPIRPAGTQSGQPRLWCHGKACEEKRGIEIHRDDPSCGKFHPPKRARATP